MKAQDHLLLGEWFLGFPSPFRYCIYLLSSSPVCRVPPSPGNRPTMSNYPLPNLQLIELTDRTNNNPDMNVTSQGPPANELDPGGRAILREHEIVFVFLNFLLQGLHLTTLPSRLVHISLYPRLTEYYRRCREGGAAGIARKQIATWGRRITQSKQGAINLSDPLFPSWTSSSRTFETSAPKGVNAGTPGRQRQTSNKRWSSFFQATSSELHGGPVPKISSAKT